MEITYRKTLKDDIQVIDMLITQAVAEMENNKIMQWDELYPTREDFLEDIRRNQLSVGCIDNQIVVVFTINQEFDSEYVNGEWKNPEKSICS